jgi:DNA-binding MarR family transcriptional regulator
MRYDALVRRKLEQEYENLPPTSSPKEDWIRRKEHKILKVIFQSENGIAHQQLARIVELDRKTLRPYLQRLISKGLIRRDIGLQGKYYPVKKADLGTSISADIISQYFLSKVLRDEERKFFADTPYFKTEFTGCSDLEHFIFEFSNRVGGFVTYILIQAMNPANNIAGNTKDNVEKDFDVQRWVGDAISIAQESLLHIFKKGASISLVNRRTKDDSFDMNSPEYFEKVAYDRIKYYMRRPFYILDETVISELMTAFSNLYPELNYALEKNRLELPTLVDQEVDRLVFSVEKNKIQDACKHNYKRLKVHLHNRKFRILHCAKCHKTKRLDQSLSYI